MAEMRPGDAGYAVARACGVAPVSGMEGRTPPLPVPDLHIMANFPDIGLRRAQGSSDGDNLRGAWWMIASCAAATAMSVAVRLLADDMTSVQMAFLRSVIGIVLLVPLFARAAVAHGPSPVRFTRPWLHGLRGMLFALATTFGFYALAHLPLATATTLFFLAPVFATVFAALFAGEGVGPRRWAAVGAAFAGALIILRPGFAPVDLAMVAAIGSSLLFAVALLITRPLSQADGGASVMLSSNVIASVVLGVPALLVWMPVPVAVWGLVLLLALSSSARMYADVRSYSLADAGFLAPFAFLRLLFIAAAGWIVFREGIDGPTLTGAAIIVGASVFIAWREAMLKRG